MKRIIVACQGAVATSTIVKSKLKNFLDENGLEGQYEIVQCKVSEAQAKSRNADLCLETTQIVGEFFCPTYSAVPFLTKRGLPELKEKILEALK
ncbi:PTS sugar transporter subunit IIB [Vagococcus fluvialis]|uniref:PTS sugar transporter subunit IIB n=1 Tax=Vagococcus fluvialis TaxID=2738 RepID=UPI00288F9285|nr:PTS sugar transporter subunit IIB [Vagococcus fluvialis]MDT2782992.1 PTS sugar transporter subunit IIB [Vagococcus fluvialis]